MRQLQQVDPSKALGPDNISPHILKHCAAQLATPLTTLFKECLSSRTWPSLWKQARVVPIHKKNTRADPKNYRPISLLSVVGKVFESLLASKITHYLDHHHLLSPKQFGFRQGRSAADLLLLQSATWNKTLDSGREAFVVALDIAGAFDKVWHQGIITKLKSLGVCGDLLLLLENYLRGRSLHTVLNGHTSSQHPINAGVPQGSVLGPLLWNVYFNDVLQLVPEAYAYADDCTLTFVHDREGQQATIERINQALDTITTWGRRWQVTLAPEKTQVLHISRRQEPRETPPPSILLDNRRVPLQDSISILGVEFDSRLSFTKHVKKVAKDAAWKLGCIRRVGDILDARGVSTLYKAQVRSIMEYSPLAWSSCPPSYLTQLDRIQNRAQRLVQLRNHDQEVGTCGLQPLQQRRDVAGLCVMFKSHTLNTPHLAALRLQPPPPPTHTTRTTQHEEYKNMVTVPFARTEHHHRSYLPRYSRLWNNLVQNTNAHHTNSIQAFKCSVNTWLQHNAT